MHWIPPGSNSTLSGLKNMKFASIQIKNVSKNVFEWKKKFVKCAAYLSYQTQNWNMWLDPKKYVWWMTLAVMCELVGD